MFANLGAKWRSLVHFPLWSRAIDLEAEYFAAKPPTPVLQVLVDRLELLLEGPANFQEAAPIASISDTWQQIANEIAAARAVIEGLDFEGQALAGVEADSYAAWSGVGEQPSRFASKDGYAVLGDCFSDAWMAWNKAQVAAVQREVEWLERRWREEHPDGSGLDLHREALHRLTWFDYVFRAITNVDADPIR